MNERRDNAVNAAAALLADNSSYHDHKEQMAHLGAVAYIGAAAAFMFSPSSWLPLRCPVLGLAAFTGLAGIAYVYWQLRHRDKAARAVKRYYNILVDELPESEPKRMLFAREPRTYWPKTILILMMLFWGICALYPALQAGCVWTK